MKVLKFYSPCCGQCRVLTKEFEKHPIDVPVKNIDITENPEIAEKYNVGSLPTIILLNDKEEIVETWRGIIKPKVINDKIKELKN